MILSLKYVSLLRIKAPRLHSMSLASVGYVPRCSAGWFNSIIKLSGVVFLVLPSLCSREPLVCSFQPETFTHSWPAKTHYWQKRDFCFYGSMEALFRKWCCALSSCLATIQLYMHGTIQQRRGWTECLTSFVCGLLKPKERNFVDLPVSVCRGVIYCGEHCNDCRFCVVVFFFFWSNSVLC